MSSIGAVGRAAEFVVEWAELEDIAPPVEESFVDAEVVRIVRFRIEGARRVEPQPADPIDPEAMLGEPLF